MLFVDKPRVLAIGSHPDDIELGAAGLLSRLLNECSASIHLLVLTSGLQSWKRDTLFAKTDRENEARRGAVALGLDRADVTVCGFEDCKLHEEVHEVIREIERHLYDSDGQQLYDIILTHASGDTHSDHKQASESTISAARYFHGTILFYQAPSTIPNEFHPTFFVKLNTDMLEKKDLAIMAHVSQREKEFAKHGYTVGMAKSWAIFHRRAEDSLEAFEIYKTYWE